MPLVNGQENSRIEPSGEPLFVLRYVRYKLLLRVLVHTVIIQLLGIAIHVMLKEHRHDFIDLLGIFIFGLIILMCFSNVVHMLFFKKIRLYEDRIIRVSNWMDEREVKLARAVFLGHKHLFAPMSFLDRDKGRLAWFGKVYYDEYLADPKEAGKLKSLLADLSGRRAEEFEGAVFTATVLTEKDKR